MVPKRRKAKVLVGGLLVKEVGELFFSFLLMKNPQCTGLV